MTDTELIRYLRAITTEEGHPLKQAADRLEELNQEQVDPDDITWNRVPPRGATVRVRVAVAADHDDYVTSQAIFGTTDDAAAKEYVLDIVDNPTALGILVADLPLHTIPEIPARVSEASQKEGAQWCAMVRNKALRSTNDPRLVPR